MTERDEFLKALLNAYAMAYVDTDGRQAWENGVLAVARVALERAAKIAEGCEKYDDSSFSENIKKEILALIPDEKETRK